MDFKKSEIYVFLFFLVVAFSLFSTNAGAEENHWKLMGKTKDKSFLVYYDTSSVNYIRKDYVSLRLKKELSEEGKEQFKQNFYASVKDAEAKTGEKVKDPEPLMKAMMKRETKENDAEIDCGKNQLRVLPEKMSKINFVFIEEIEAGTAIEKIRDEVCPKH